MSKFEGPQIGDFLQEQMLQAIILMDLSGIKRHQFMTLVQEDQSSNLLLFILKIIVWELMLIGAF